MTDKLIFSAIDTLLFGLCVAAFTFLLQFLWHKHKNKKRRIERRKAELSKAQRKAAKNPLTITPFKTWSQTEALINFYRELDGLPTLPPLRGWAFSPDALFVLLRHVEKNRPKLILECGCGSSTIAMAMAFSRYGIDGHIHTLEHQSEYADKLRGELVDRNLHIFVTIHHCPLQEYRYEGFEQTFHWYDPDGVPDLNEVDLLIVDGPPRRTGPLARYPAGPELIPKLSAGAHIFIDDADRPDENQLPELWRKISPEFRYSQHVCEKGLIEMHRLQ